jgi:hypothetical protein
MSFLRFHGCLRPPEIWTTPNPLAANEIHKSMAHKPFVCFSMNTNGQTFANATGNGGAISHSGWANGGTTGTAALWNDHENF